MSRLDQPEGRLESNFPTVEKELAQVDEHNTHRQTWFLCEYVDVDILPDEVIPPSFRNEIGIPLVLNYCKMMLDTEQYMHLWPCQ